MHEQLVHSNPLSTILPSTGQNQRYGNILLYATSVIILKMDDHDGNHRYLVENNVPMVLIFPSRWQDGAESLGMETTSCLWCALSLPSQKVLSQLDSCCVLLRTLFLFTATL